MSQNVKKAMIVIGNIKQNYSSECEIYYYPENITEWELAEEIFNLINFYDEIIYPSYWPPHLRKEKVIEWTKEFQHIPCELEEQKGQCSMFCYKYNYEKGCILCQ